MKAAPTPTIDVNGVATWVDDPTCLGGYFVTSCFDNGVANWYQGSSANIGVGVTSFDTFTAGWLGGQRLQLVGLDADNNILTNPTSSVGYLTKNI
jgi:hypothetical protein